MARLFRLFVCFAVICAMIVGFFPEKTAASSAVAVVEASKVCFANPGMIPVAACILITLGVMSDPDVQDSFRSASQQAAEFLIDSGASFLKVVDDAGSVSYYASAELLESVRSWLFDSGILVNSAETYAAGSTITLSNGDSLVVDQKCYRVRFVGAKSTGRTFYDWVFSERDSNLTYCLNGSTEISQGVKFGNYRVHRTSLGISSSEYYNYPSIGTEGKDYTSSTTNRIIWCYENGYLGVSAADAMRIGCVPLVPITSGERTDILAGWAEKQLWVDYTDALGVQVGTEVHYPLYPGTYEDLLTMTQTEVLADAGVLSPGITWPGTNTGEEEEEKYKVLGSSLVDGRYDAISLTDANTSNGAGSSDIVTPPPSTDYSFDLTEYFPFCLPFDIYKFLDLLAADPVAPVFEWVIPVPQMDKEFTVTVDLSAWDSVAKIFRTFELFAFIVGLALITRDKFLRG